MLRQPTVIVVGARAGVDIDMPVGSVLSGTIASKLNIRLRKLVRQQNPNLFGIAAQERGRQLRLPRWLLQQADREHSQ
jgi:hypothetical protein